MVGFVVAVGVLAAGFGVVERLAPASPARRTAWGLDLAWLLTGRVVDPLVKLAIGVACAAPVALLGLSREREVLLAGYGPLAALPAPVALALVLFLSDGLSAAVHRLHHRWPRLWRVHAVHHSSRHLDWLAAARVHPLNEVLNRAPAAVALLTLGFDLRVVAAAAPVLTLWAIGLHANVDWRLGPLRYVVATPGFHRWHHARPPAHLPDGCNFAGLFPVWDLLAGTFWLPPEPAREFGVDEPPVPESFARQLFLRF